jgi:tetratricopeptide (TPR) repeat protein
MVRSAPEGPLDAVLVLGTLGAPERRRLRGRRARPVEEAEPEPVPTSRATVVRPEPFGSREEAAAWLAGLRGNDSAMEGELDEALRILNRALRAHRAAAADPWLAEVSAERALVARIGYGRGEAIAEGRYGEALELPRAGARRVKRSMEAPEERFAALLGARSEALVGEELVLRARADLAAGRPREAALQARVALEALVAELPDAGTLPELRSAVAAAAGAALRGELGAAETMSIEEAVQAMEAALRRHRLRG